MTKKSPIRIEYAGRLALTCAQAAARHGMATDTMRQILKRLDEKGILHPLPHGIDARTALYDAAKLDEAIAARPGKGKAYPQTGDGRRKAAA